MAKAKAKIDLEGDAQLPAPSTEQLKGITDLINKLKLQQKRYANGAQLLKELGDEIERLSSVEIPEAMKAIGLKDFTMVDGSVVEVKESDYGSFTKDNEARVFAFLRKGGHGDIIKSKLSVDLGKDSAQLAEKLQKVLGQKAFANCVVDFKESVHPQTFNAFVREQLEEGKPLPKQIAIFHKCETLIKEPKNGNSSKKTSSKARSQSNDRF